MRFRKLGVGFVLVSILISLGNICFTGAVVGGESSGFFSLVSIVFFIGGVVMIFVSGTLEKRVLTKEGIVDPGTVMDRISYVKGGEEGTVVVGDTSFFGSFNDRDVRILMGDLDEKYGKPVVVDSVLDDLKLTRKKRDIVLNGSVTPSDDYKSCLKEARRYLEGTKKASHYREIVAIAKGRKKPSRREAAKYKVVVEKLAGNLISKGKAPTIDNLVEEAKSHWKVSDADVDVLAAAISEARKGRVAVLLGKDSHFKDALGVLKKKDSKLGDRIHYINPYASAA